MRIKSSIVVSMIIYSILLLGCNGIRKIKNENGENSFLQNLVNQSGKDDSFFYLEKLVLSSNFPFLNDVPKKDIHILLDNQENFVYICNVYLGTNEQEVGIGTMGWISYDAKCNKLYNISADLPHPQELSYDKNIEIDFIKSLNTEIPACVEIKTSKLPFTKEEKSFKTLSLPFSLEKYLAVLFSNTNELEREYPSNIISSYFEEILSSKDYEGEDYKCFFLPSKTEDIFNMITWIQRGDHEYYLLITANKDSIIDYKEVGIIGADTPMFFIITENLEVEKYETQNTRHKIIEKLKIKNDGKIIRIE